MEFQLYKKKEKERALCFMPNRQLNPQLNAVFLSLRKEVIQPHFPVRLPCYDFTPLTRHTFGTVPQING